MTIQLSHIINKRIVALIGVLLFYTALYADVKMTATAPTTVAVGEQFQLQITVNSQEIKSFKGPGMSDFDVLYGPARSSMNSYQMINGRSSSTSSTTFTYMLVAQNTGTFVISSAQANVEGKNVRSNAIKIKVVAGNGGSHSSSGNSSQRQQMSTANQSGNRITGKDLFITATASKTNVYEQEAILVTYKVYSLVNLTQLDGKMPDLKGFHCQEVNLPQTKSFSLDKYNGKTYRSVVWKQYVIFPQQTGKLEIPSITFEGVVAQENRAIDPIDAFFNSGSAYVEVRKKLVTPKIQINVTPLPSKPANFSGAVGKYTIQAKDWAKSGKTGEAMTFQVVVNGNGNMKLIKAPTIAFPKDFETYDTKQTDATKLTSNGVAGNVTYSFVAVPRHTGEYTIPGAEFCFYDIASKEYKTIKTNPVTVNIEKGNGNSSHYSSKENVKMLNQDILYIKLGDAKTIKRDSFFVASAYYWLIYIILSIVFVALYVSMRRYIAGNVNTAYNRGRKANKVAVKRLKTAGTYLEKHQQNEFYDEIMRALFGYASDKFNISNEYLSKDKIEEQLVKSNVQPKVIKQFIGLLNDCEFARFAPQAGSEAKMNKLYDSAIDVIIRIENANK